MFAGLEPVVNTGTPNAIVVTFDDPTDTLTVRTTATEIFVDSVKHEGFSLRHPADLDDPQRGWGDGRDGLAVILPSTVTLTVNTAGNLDRRQAPSPPARSPSPPSAASRSTTASGSAPPPAT